MMYNYATFLRIKRIHLYNVLYSINEFYNLYKSLSGKMNKCIQNLNDVNCSNVNVYLHNSFAKWNYNNENFITLRAHISHVKTLSS